MKTQKKYEAPQTQHAEVELEQGFMSGSVVDEDKQEKPTISIQDQEVGAESDYFLLVFITIEQPKLIRNIRV